MEYNNFHLLWLGLLLTALWSMKFWNIGITPVLYSAQKSLKKSISITKLVFYLIGLSGLLSLSYSLTGPRRAVDVLPSNYEVNDIFMVIDVSRSMLADDLKPNRLEVAKEKLREFVKLKPTDRIGLIVFSEKVFTLLPLTIDPGLIDQVLESVRVGYLGGGTNMGDALGLAVARGIKSETKNKVIILLTDGVNNVGNLDPLQAAQMAKENKIKVYTIGLGTDETARLPVGKSFFGRQRYQKIPGGSIDMVTLKKISDMTGGKTYRANSDTALSEILKDIDELEKSKINIQGQTVYNELYYTYFLIGFLLFLLSEGLGRFYLREVL